MKYSTLRDALITAHQLNPRPDYLEAYDELLATGTLIERTELEDTQLSVITSYCLFNFLNETTYDDLGEIVKPLWDSSGEHIIRKAMVRHKYHTAVRRKHNFEYITNYQLDDAMETLIDLWVDNNPDYNDSLGRAKTLDAHIAEKLYNLLAELSPDRSFDEIVAGAGLLPGEKTHLAQLIGYDCKEDQVDG